MKRYLYDRALEWFNEEREAVGKAPLPELPKGFFNRDDECTGARALGPGSKVKCDVVHHNGRVSVPPHHVRLFLWLFDRGFYEELHTSRPAFYGPASAGFLFAS